MKICTKGDVWCKYINQKKSSLESLAIGLSRFWGKNEQNLDYYRKKNIESVSTSKAIARKWRITGMFTVWGRSAFQALFFRK